MYTEEPFSRWAERFLGVGCSLKSSLLVTKKVEVKNRKESINRRLPFFLSEIFFVYPGVEFLKKPCAIS
jgi:hypothetical protein